MIEKSVILKDIPLVDFLGVRNRNINELVATFPKSKIVSRGNKITIQGEQDDIARIVAVLEELICHFNRFGRITVENVTHYTNRDQAESLLKHVKDDVLLYGSQGTPIKIRTPNQQKLVDAAESHDLVFAIGPAGTGKTYVSVALAVRALKKKQVKKIVITRPVVEAGESLGFLPGDVKAKIDPYLRPIYDVLREIISIEKMAYYLDKGIVEIAPLAYMRGRTLHNAFILLDEAQNTTCMQMKMALTRMGPESKMLVTGDDSQVDLPPSQRSGLENAMRTLRHIPDIAFVTLTYEDVIRHPLMKAIVQAYRQCSHDSEG